MRPAKPEKPKPKGRQTMNSSLTALPPHLTVNIPRDLIDVDSDFDSNASTSRASSGRGRKRAANSRSPARTPPSKKSKASAKPAAKKASKSAGARASPRSSVRRKGKKATKMKSKEIVDDSMESNASEVEEEIVEGDDQDKEDLNKKMFQKVRTN